MKKNAKKLSIILCALIVTAVAAQIFYTHVIKSTTGWVNGSSEYRYKNSAIHLFDGAIDMGFSYNEKTVKQFKRKVRIRRVYSWSWWNRKYTCYLDWRIEHIEYDAFGVEVWRDNEYKTGKYKTGDSRSWTMNKPRPSYSCPSRSLDPNKVSW